MGGYFERQKRDQGTARNAQRRNGDYYGILTEGENMKLWDGYDKHRNERTRYDTASNPRFTYYIDKDGSIFYTDSETPTEPRVWCPASMLTAHLVRLYQIKNR